MNAEECRQFPRETSERYQSLLAVEVDEEVNIARRSLVASRHAAEHTNVAGTPKLSGVNHGTSMTS